MKITGFRGKFAFTLLLLATTSANAEGWRDMDTSADVAVNRAPAGEPLTLRPPWILSVNERSTGNEEGIRTGKLNCRMDRADQKPQAIPETERIRSSGGSSAGKAQ